jgi:hypothetical protein
VTENASYISWSWPKAMVMTLGRHSKTRKDTAAAVDREDTAVVVAKAAIRGLELQRGSFSLIFSSTYDGMRTSQILMSSLAVAKDGALVLSK